MDSRDSRSSSFKLFAVGEIKRTAEGWVHSLALPRALKGNEGAVLQHLLYYDWYKNRRDLSYWKSSLLQRFKKCPKTWEHYGMDQDTLGGDVLPDDFFPKAKSIIYGDPDREIIALQQIEEIPQDSLDWERSESKACSVIGGCAAVCGVAGLVALGGKYLAPSVARRSLLMAAGASVVGTYGYMTGLLNPLLPKSFQVSDNLLSAEAYRAQLRSRLEQMAKHANHSLITSPQRTMLMVVPSGYVRGLTEIFLSDYTFSEFPLN